MTERVGTTARVLGYAGLLPMVFATAVIATAPWSGLASLNLTARVVAFTYPLLILSFIGGAWWGLAMRAGDAQGNAVIVGVAPTLLGFALAGAALATGQVGWSLAVVGSVIALTLLVDRGFVVGGVAPEGWMTLRAPLSLGLGALTIVAGALIERV